MRTRDVVGHPKLALVFVALMLAACATHQEPVQIDRPTSKARPLPTQCGPHTPESIAQRNSSRLVADPARSWDTSIFFDQNSAELDSTEREHLFLFLQRLNVGNPAVFSLGTIIVAGYAEVKEQQPQSVSESRAKSVGDLISKLGVAPEHLVVLGEGVAKSPFRESDEHVSNQRADIAVVGACLFDFPVRSSK